MISTQTINILGNTKETLLDKPYVESCVFKDTKTGLVTWKGKCSFDEFKEAYQVIIDAQHRLPIDYFIADIRNQGLTTQDKKDWFKNTALKQAIDNGIKKGAAITDNNAFKEFYLNFILKAYNVMSVPFKTFSNQEDAMAWLQK